MIETSAVILLIEDDDAHAALITRVLEGEIAINNIHRVCDGEEALDYLFHRGNYATDNNSPLPGLILLDLRLPKLDGHEVLTAIKKSDQLKCIPVVVLTTSNSETDMIKAYENHANSYLVKPLGFGEFAELIREMSSYWLVRNKHPHQKD